MRCGLRRLGLVSLALASACGGPRIRGTIDGRSVDLVDGYFVQAASYDFGTGTTDEGGTDSLMYVVLTDFAEACATAIQVEEGLAAAASPQEAADAWSALPPEFWEITLVLRVGDPDDDQSGLVLDGLGRGQRLDERDEAFGTLVAHDEPFDVAWWGGAGAPEDYFEQWTTDGGELTVNRHTPGEALAGRFDTEAATLDGTEVGDLIIRFSVDRCAGMERFFFP
jgi:hypothetical protein